MVLDLKNAQARDILLDLAASADALIEGFRPGVMERLGLGPDVLLARNRRLVYGRMTGWGQDGPLATAAGHDINYIAVAGALQPLSSRGGPPMPPLNMLGDFGGGAMLLACGVLAGILNARTTGTGQVADAAIVDGTALLTAMVHSMRAEGQWSEPPGGNLLDGCAPYYGVYETADGGWLAVGALESQFYAQLLLGLGLADELAGVKQDDQSSWPWMRDRFAQRIRERSRTEWVDRLQRNRRLRHGSARTARDARRHASRGAPDVRRGGRAGAARAGAALQFHAGDLALTSLCARRGQQGTASGTRPHGRRDRFAG